MIKKLEIDNFRSHRKTILNFVKGVNCIIGLPESGKTNIIRAINWVLTNRPLGFRVHSDFTDDPTMVTLQFEEGNEVTLGKTKKTSEYSFNDTPLRAIDKDVPDVIAKASAMSDLNLQRQLDKPFLICSTAGEVARVFNKITRLEKPDLAVSLLTMDINSENKKLKMLQSQKNELQDKIDKIGDVKSMVDRFVDLEDRSECIFLLQNKETELREIIKQIESSQEKLKSIGDVKAMKEDLGRVEDIYQDLIDMEDDRDGLSEIIVDIETRQKECESILQLKMGIRKSFRLMENLFDTLCKVNDQWEELNVAIEEITSAIDVLERTKDKLVVKAKEYREFLNTIDVCPYCSVCKEPISKHNLDDAIKGLI